ncbi:hypothetical protein FRB93_006134 [Tulasnella sp. JGI-2019a]|nr:hypothetical protein FRB93_006134 [Tulasnella sp. JGI-2019a]
MRESSGEEVSSGPSTGTTAIVQESIAGVSIAEMERSDGPNISDGADSDLV